MAHARTTQPVLTAQKAGLLGCRICGRANPGAAQSCSRCGAALHRPGGLQAVMAWLLAGLVVYIPANTYPMLRTKMLGEETDSTILGGAIDLAHHGSWGVAGIVFVASILIPIAKFITIGYLALAVHRRWPMRGRLRFHLYEAVEFIGRWSMIDVFVVAILVALVQFNLAATIAPGIAAVSFALSVIFTMLAAQAFDPRLIWQSADTDTE
ncbi:paraquat-inducible protein A [Pararhodobacter marinus]|uniref:Paraquat-inducible membrane protein A n=1 Tax=Pararhodobacter marinus TaxID=2184063 RepID=A0A2U2C895_9RHOB|nr:paraquat-inducible protein A [Pararhodobacter marinus]PWE28118.1 paraquat-inducible membrane protein A [Pararhodobacter marinus]